MFPPRNFQPFAANCSPAAKGGVPRAVLCFDYITSAASLGHQQRSSPSLHCAQTMCHSRNHVHTMTGLPAPAPAPSTGSELRRGSGPEIFTFDPLPERAVAPAARLHTSRGHRKRSRRVLYPRVVSVAGVGSRGSRRSGTYGGHQTAGTLIRLNPLLSLPRSGASCQPRNPTLPRGSSFSCSPSSSARS